jgi:hypothetical protein
MATRGARSVWPHLDVAWAVVQLCFDGLPRDLREHAQPPFDNSTLISEQQLVNAENPSAD